jgi:hypothetical protein
VRDLEFVDGLEVQVEVLDDVTDDPVPSATITVMERCFSGSFVAGFGAPSWVTDTNGSSLLDHLNEDVPALSVTAEGYGALLLIDPLSKGVGSPPVLEVRLGRGGTVEGKVEVSYAAPETAVTVHARPIGFEVGRSARVDRDGNYRIDGLPPGPVEVRLEDLLYTMRYMDVDLPARQVVVKAGEVTRLDWLGQGGTVVEGLVKGYDGPAIISAYALGDQDSVDGQAGGAPTNREHRFRIPGLRPGRYLLVGRSAEAGRGLCSSKVIDVVEGNARHEVVLEIGGSEISGRVFAGAGALPRASIQIYTTSEGRTVAKAAVLTAQDGSFRVAGVNASSVDVLISERGYGTYSASGLSAPVDLGRIDLLPEAVLVMTVIDDRGAPVSGAVATLARSMMPDLTRREAYTNLDGRCVLNELSGGQWQASVSCPGHERGGRVVELRSGRRDEQTLVLPRLGSLRLQVRGRDDLAAAGVSLSVTSSRGTDLSVDSPLTTNEEGILALRDLPAGEYFIKCVALDLESRTTVRPGEETELTVGGR